VDGWPEPQIDYPCRWTYKVVGMEEAVLRSVVAGIVQQREHSITLARTSRTGRYVSLAVEVLVHDHDERRGIATRLGEHPDVKFVL
jgi:putative lipoic acid-binding regulatory protein